MVVYPILPSLSSPSTPSGAPKGRLRPGSRQPSLHANPGNCDREKAKDNKRGRASTPIVGQRSEYSSHPATPESSPYLVDAVVMTGAQTVFATAGAYPLVRFTLCHGRESDEFAKCSFIR